MGVLMRSIIEKATQLVELIQGMDVAGQVEALNSVRTVLHEASPFKDHPVDLVLWVPNETVEGNPYNPNTVAPPEMRLLETSISADGYTQPVVSNQEGSRRVVVDGFHRSRVGKESKAVRKTTHGYLPVVQIRSGQKASEDRMASTIRHNRARGRHGVDEMSSIVAELAKKGWNDEKISKELGMDADEVLRLKQITGLAELFSDREFSSAWDIEESS